MAVVVTPSTGANWEPIKDKMVDKQKEQMELPKEKLDAHSFTKDDKFDPDTVGKFSAKHFIHEFVMPDIETKCGGHGHVEEPHHHEPIHPSHTHDEPIIQPLHHHHNPLKHDEKPQKADFASMQSMIEAQNLASSSSNSVKPDSSTAGELPLDTPNIEDKHQSMKELNETIKFNTCMNLLSSGNFGANELSELKQNLQGLHFDHDTAGYYSGGGDLGHPNHHDTPVHDLSHVEQQVAAALKLDPNNKYLQEAQRIIDTTDGGRTQYK